MTSRTTGMPVDAASAGARFVAGQRWISVSEPELGLGEVEAVGARTVTMWFPATRERREYVNDADAPIRRAAYRAGDTISTRVGGDVIVDAVTEHDGLLRYRSGSHDIPESDLSHTLSFSSPLERLFAGQFDASATFDLRLSALSHQHQRRQSRVRGFLGGRIDLLSHQLGIASEVTGRLIPRVLLADDVGLGKTIEACLILHRLLLTGRAQRVLIVVPESLVHQWFLELLRRFNLWFHIFTEARCLAIEEHHPATNPFLDDQLLLCDLALFTDSDRRLAQATEAGWDVVIVDEAHHLGWSPSAASPEYLAVERLGRVSPGLLLLTATPEQLGVASHFARLRLLDPDRFHDFETFLRESESYREVARLAALLMDEAPVSDADQAALATLLREDRTAIASELNTPADLPRARQVNARVEWINRLLDQHGTGRVMFRNTKSAVAGFPRRVARLHPLEAGSTARHLALAEEWRSDSTGPRVPEEDGALVLTHDPRIAWLVSLLQGLAGDKVLLICHTQRKAAAIESALRHRTTIPVALFHEALTLVQRDRGAAWFADPDGARLLICSEIGSEGRNFQFAHHLVLFDLPIDPGLLEQRIGRLDRIGQRDEIEVHVPVIRASHLEVLVRWYHAGLNAFEEHLPGGRELLDRFEPELRDLASRAHTDRRTIGATLDSFIDRVRDARADISARLEAGRDRLLEWNSSRPALSAHVIDMILREDVDRTLDEFMLRVFDEFFIAVEEIAPRTWRLGSAGILVDEFPGLKADGLTCTRDRARALLREDVQFLTWDHPLVSGALDMLLSSERGNCSFGRWPDDAVSALYLDAVYVLECVAPPALHVDRFMPPTPVRVTVDHRGRDASNQPTPSSVSLQSTARSAGSLLTRPDIRDTLLPRLVERTKQLAESQSPAIVSAARVAMRAQLAHETSRLRELQTVNRTARDEEIELLESQQRELDACLDSARLRLDALRLIRRGPQGKA